MHWDGNQWNHVPGPDYLPGNYLNTTFGVKAIASDDAWTVGYWTNKQGPTIEPSQPLTLHWDGKEWTYVPNSGPGLNDNILQSIAATSSSDMWGVGQYWDGFGYPFRTLAERYSPDQSCTPEPTVTGTPRTRTPRPTHTSTSTRTSTSTSTPVSTSTSTGTATSTPTSTAILTTPTTC